MTPRSLLPLLLAPFLLIRGTAQASTDEAEKRLKASIDEVVVVARKASDRKVLMAGVKPIMENILSMEAMTRRAVGPGWRQFSPEQQKEAIRLFTALILRTYTAKFTPGELPAVEYKTPTTPAPNRVEIPTTALYKGSRYEVIYRMEETTGGAWWITDVVIEGVSMVANYRTQFDAVFKQGGADAVIQALNRSLEESK